MPNRPRRSHNPKRTLVVSKPGQGELDALADRVRYGGNPEHKKNPRDFGLTPPSAPRSEKTLCDDAGILLLAEAQALLRRGVLRGFISEQRRGEFPQNIWSVTDGGIALEAQLENQESGTYHGYPMTAEDPHRERILRAWMASELVMDPYRWAD